MVQTGKSSLLARYGARADQAAQQAAGQELDFGIQNLPPGITNAVVQLKECGFEIIPPTAKYDVGEVRYKAIGVIVEPEWFQRPDGNRVKIGGQQVRKYITVGDTKNKEGKVSSLADHVTEIMNEMGLLANSKDFTKHVRVVSDLEPLAQQLQLARPYFYFSTRAGQVSPQYPNPRTWEDWNGSRGLENYVPPDKRGAAMADQTAPHANGVPANGGAAPTGGGRMVAVQQDDPSTLTPDNEFQEQEAEPQGVEPTDEGDGLTLDAEAVEALAAQADAGDHASKVQMKQLALENGIPEADFDDAPDYATVASWLLNAGDGEPPVEEPVDEWKPEVGQLYGYQRVGKDGKHLINPRTKKPIPPGKVEVTAVFSKNETVTVKDVTTQKVLVGSDKKPLLVKWTALIRE